LLPATICPAGPRKLAEEEKHVRMAASVIRLEISETDAGDA
jgi:hypothetical protein